MVIQLRMLSATIHRKYLLIHRQLRPLLLNKTKQNRRFLHHRLLFFFIYKLHHLRFAILDRLMQSFNLLNKRVRFLKEWIILIFRRKIIVINGRAIAFICNLKGHLQTYCLVNISAHQQASQEKMRCGIASPHRPCSLDHPTHHL